MFLATIANATSLQDFLTVFGQLFGSPIILAIALLAAFAFITIVSKLDSVTTLFLTYFFLFGLIGWNNPVLGFTQNGLAGQLEPILVLLFLVNIGAVVIGVWVWLNRQL